MEPAKPKPKRVKTVVYIDPALRRRLKVTGAQTDRSGGDIVEEALGRYFDEKPSRSQVSHSA